MFETIKQRLAGADKPSVLFALASAWPIIGFLPSIPKVVSYGIVLTYAAYCISKANRIETPFFFLLLYIPIELLIAQPSGIFHSWQRYFFFAALLVNVSPFMQSSNLRKQRSLVFQLMLWVCSFIGVGSFFARFLGLNFMRSVSVESLSSVGTFAGLTTHSMLLGPIAGIAACYLSSRALSTRRTIDWAWVVLTLFSVLFSASRAALLGTLTGIIITLLCQSRTASKFLRVLVVSIVIASSTYSIWEGALSGIREKNGASSTVLNLDSRQRLWDARIDDFKSSPVFGVGFCAASITESSIIDVNSGQIESGTSWIIIFSMLGIVGAIIIIPIFIRGFKTAYRSRGRLSPVICGVLSLFFVHMFAEGYIFSGGSFLALMLWLTIGVATDSKYQEEW